MLLRTDDDQLNEQVGQSLDAARLCDVCLDHNVVISLLQKRQTCVNKSKCIYCFFLFFFVVISVNFREISDHGNISRKINLKHLKSRFDQ